MGIREYKEIGSYTGVLNVLMGNLGVGPFFFFSLCVFLLLFLPHTRPSLPGHRHCTSSLNKG